MDARAFWNGVRGRNIERARVGWSTGKVFFFFFITLKPRVE